MGWPLTFREKIAASVIAPILAIQCEESLDIFSTAPIIAGSLQTVYPWLAQDSVTFGQYGVQPVEWVPESGAWRFAVIVGPVEHGRRLTVLRAFGRGAMVRLKMGFPGDGWTDFQTVAQGRISKTEITAAGVIVIEVWDIVSALTARWAGGGDLRAEPQLFSKYRAPTTLTAAYTVGDTTLSIAAPEPDATRQTGATGVVKVTPTGGTAFYLRYTGSATGPDRLTGVTATLTYGTTAVNAALGSVVEYVPLVFGSIPDLVCKVLTSTGGGTNGAYDVLPETWGYGLRDGIHVDVADIQSSTNSPLTAGLPVSGQIEVVVDPDPDDGLAWLNGVIAPYGAFLTVRQGLITLRCCQDIRPQSASTVRVQRYGVNPTQVMPESLSVSSSDWSNIAYSVVAVRNTTGTTTAPGLFRSYPSHPLKTYDLSASLWSFTTDVRAATVARLKAWAWIPAEVITCDVTGLDVWDLCPGDVIRWTYPYAGGLYASTLDGWSARLAMVVSVQPDPLRGTVALTLATLPDDAADRLEV